LNPIIFSDGWRHASRGVIDPFMRFLTFFSSDDLIWVVRAELSFVFMEDENLVFRPCYNDIIIDQFHWDV